MKKEINLIIQLTWIDWTIHANQFPVSFCSRTTHTPTNPTCEIYWHRRAVKSNAEVSPCFSLLASVCETRTIIRIASGVNVTLKLTFVRLSQICNPNIEGLTIITWDRLRAICKWQDSFGGSAYVQGFLDFFVKRARKWVGKGLRMNKQGRRT